MESELFILAASPFFSSVTVREYHFQAELELRADLADAGAHLRLANAFALAPQEGIVGEGSLVEGSLAAELF